MREELIKSIFICGLNSKHNAIKEKLLSEGEKNGDKKCGRCGMIHEIRCPAIGTACHYCGKPDHFARMCMKLVKKKMNYAQNLELDSDDERTQDKEDDLFVGSVTVTNFRGKPKWTVELEVNNRSLVCQIDTGADTNIISLESIWP